MKQVLQEMIRAAVARAHQSGALYSDATGDFVVEAPKLDHHGDFASNVALVSAKQQRMAPRRLAEILLAHLDDPGQRIERTEIAGPGFINFRIARPFQTRLLMELWDPLGSLQDIRVGGGKRINVEFISANPTGPLHVGHGRGAVLGSTLAQVLAAAGYRVEREYYINDVGNQIDAFSRSIWARYRQCFNIAAEIPADGYFGSYMIDLARQIVADEGGRFLNRPEAEAVADHPPR